MEMKSFPARSVGGLLAGAGLVVAAVNNFVTISEMVMLHFWSVLALSVALGLSATWPPPERRAPGFRPVERPRPPYETARRYRWPVVIIAVAAAVAAIRWQKQWHPARLPAGEYPQDPTAPIPASGRLGSQLPMRLVAVLLPRVAEASQRERLELLSFGLSPEKTSYREMFDAPDMDSAVARLPRYVFPRVRCDAGNLRPLAPPQLPVKDEERPGDTCMRFRDRCYGFPEKARVLEALRTFARRRGRSGSLLYLDSYEVLHNLVRRDGAALKTILPQGDEWRSIQPEDGRAVIQRWYRECVGLAYPVFRIVLRNPGRREVLVTAMRYYRLEFGGGAGPGAAGPDAVLVPAAIYAHGLETQNDKLSEEAFPYRPVRPVLKETLGHLNDDPSAPVFMENRPTRRALTPALRVAPGATVSFEVQLYPIGGGAFDTMLFGIDILTSDGIVRIPEFFADFWSPVG